MSVPTNQRLVEEEPVELSPAEQSQVLAELAETRERARLAEKAVEKQERAKAREVDSKFGFLRKLTVGVIKCGVYRENPRTYEYEYVPEGSVMWNVDREDKTAFQDKLSRLFGGGRYRIEMQFPKDSGIEDSTLEISIADKPETAIVPSAAPSNEGSMAAEFAKVVVEMQNSNREFFKWMMEQSQKQTATMADQTQRQNAAMMEAVKSSLTQTSRPDPSRDEMLKLVTELVKSQGGGAKPVDPITMLSGLAQVMSSLKLLVPTPTASGGIDATQIMPQIFNALKLGAELGANSGGAIAEVAEGDGTLEKLIKFVQPLMPLLGGLLTPKPSIVHPLPSIQSPPPPPATPQRPQPRDIKGRRPVPAPSSPTPQRATSPLDEAVPDVAKARSEIDQLVDVISNSLPEDAALEIKQSVAPAFLELAKDPDKVLALISNFRPELKSDGMFGIKLRQVCAALSN